MIDKTVRFYGKKEFGNPVRIDNGVHCTVNIKLGDYVHISPLVSIIGGGESKFIAEGFNNIMAGARIICSSDRFDGSGLFGSLIPDKQKGNKFEGTITMEYFSNIGTNAIVMPGSILRRGVLLCAGSLLIGDTKEWGIYKGNPARLVKFVDSKKSYEKAKELGYNIEGRLNNEKKKKETDEEDAQNK